MRCLTLAYALRARGVEVVFICREHPGHLCDRIVSDGFVVHRLPRSSSELANDNRIGWLGATLEDDASATQNAIASLGAPVDWLVADHYAIDAKWERSVKAVARRLMVVDDLADRAHDCDLLLDQNYVHAMDTRYDDLLPAGCSRLLGPSYALLQPEYSVRHSEATPRADGIKRLLISFGGADRHNLASRALNAVLSLCRDDIAVDVALSEGSLHRESVERIAKGHASVTVYYALRSLAPLIATADLAIGAGGATNWERLCFGLPSLVVTIADNQRPIAEALHADGFIEWLGDEPAVDAARIASAVGALLDRGLDRAWSLRCLDLVDGRGAERVAAAIALDAATPLRVRPASVTDEALLLQWANDSTTRNNSFSPMPILPQSHRSWFRDRLRNHGGCRLYLAETRDGVAVGQARFDRESMGWVISYAVAPLFRGRGVGRAILEVALAEFHAEEADTVVIGVVRRENVASNRIFESLGFERVESEREIVWSRTA